MRPSLLAVAAVLMLAPALALAQAPVASLGAAAFPLHVPLAANSWAATAAAAAAAIGANSTRLRCRCMPAEPVPCTARNATITAPAAAATAATAAQVRVRGWLGDVRRRRIVTTSLAPLACGEGGDGAHPGEIAGSVGGDPVEMLLAAVVVERLLGRRLTDMEVTRLVRTYIARLRAPYITYHTTATAAITLQRRVGMDFSLVDPPPAIAPAILAALAEEPAAHGCIVLADMVRATAASAPTSGSSGSSYTGLRRPLLAAVIEALHGIVWNAADALRDRIRYIVTGDGDAGSGGNGATAASATMTAPPLGVGDVAGTAVMREGTLQWPPSQQPANGGPPQPPLHVRLRLGGKCDGERELLAPPITAAGRGAISVEHPTTLAARRQAVSGLLAGAFGVNAGNAARELTALGAEWARAARGSEVWRRAHGGGSGAISGGSSNEAVEVDVVVS